MELKGNTILITGGASGIGFAFATRFVKAGSKVIICGRRQEQLEKAKAQCPQLITYSVDLANPEAREKFAAQIVKDHLDLNVLMNNAGIQNRPPPFFEKQDWASHQKEIDTNIGAPFHLSMLFLPHLMKAKNPKLMNVSSGLGFVPISFMPTYCATKAALHSFSLTLRHQLKNTPVQVIEVIPPAVNTDLGGPGLHSHAADLNLFTDHCMEKLAAGETEFGYESSEKRRLAVRNSTDEIFKMMNP